MGKLAMFPTKSAGPAQVKGPLKNGLVRLIFGNVRTNTSCIVWDDSGPTDRVWIECGSSSADRKTSKTDSVACVSVPASGGVLDKWMDFSVTKLKDFRLNFTVFGTLSSTGEEGRNVLGNACILGDELRDLIGILRRPLINENGQSVGILTLSFLVVKPYVAPRNLDFDEIWDSVCSMRTKELSISWITGHRGMGKTKPHLPRENTVHSFIESTRSKYVNHIELDVQLTKDGYPVVYHDWFFRTSGRDKDEDRSPLSIPPYRLTLREFQALYTSNVRTEKRAPPCKSSIASVSNDEKLRYFLAQDTVRTLAQVCRSLPVDIGIMVEVKYPAPNVQEEDQIIYPERNELVDRILHDLYSVPENAKRSIMFLSFEADICQMLALKQDTFPVFFSSCAARDKPCEMLDPRCVDVKQGVDFATIQGMHGMMYFEDIVRTEKDAVTYAKSHGLQVVTYGAKNMNEQWVVRQINMGVDGVVTDEAPKVGKKAMELLGDKASEKCVNEKMMLDVGIEELTSKRSTKFVNYELF